MQERQERELWSTRAQAPALPLNCMKVWEKSLNLYDPQGPIDQVRIIIDIAHGVVGNTFNSENSLEFSMQCLISSQKIEGFFIGVQGTRDQPGPSGSTAADQPAVEGSPPPAASFLSSATLTFFMPSRKGTFVPELNCDVKDQLPFVWSVLWLHR